MTKTNSFWGYVREREAIRVRRANGQSPPWTSDVVLRDHSFTNVRRDDDPDTKRSIALVGEAARTPYDYVLRTYAYRCLNRQETFDRYGLPTWRTLARWIDRLNEAAKRGEVLGSGKHLTFWSNASRALVRITPEIARRIYTSPNGIDAIRVMRAVRPTLYVGPYLGTLIVGDLALSGWGGRFDRETLVPIANGARVGLAILDGADPSEAHALFKETGAASRRARSFEAGIASPLLERVFSLSLSSNREVGFPLTFMDIENCLCEFSRYARLASGLTGPWQRRIKR